MVHSGNKGGRGERQIVKLLKEWWGSDFFRTPRSGAFATQGFTHKEIPLAADIATTDETFPFSVEVKWQESWHMEQLIKSALCAPWKWWEQCVSEAPEGKIPILTFKRNRQPWYYMLFEADAKFVHGFSFRMRIPGKQERIPCGYRRVQIGLLSELLKTDKNLWIAFQGLRIPPKYPR